MNRGSIVSKIDRPSIQTLACSLLSLNILYKMGVMRHELNTVARIILSGGPQCLSLLVFPLINWFLHLKLVCCEVASPRTIIKKKGG